MSPFPTAKERIALDLLYEWLEESPINRTYDEYLRIAAHVPKLEAIFQYVNERLRHITETGAAPYEICYFKRGDRHIWYEPFPTSLSRETVRTALKKSGLLELREIARAGT